MQLNFKHIGSGEPLIIVHGLYGASDNWVTSGKLLAEHFSVYIIDQRNHGHSPHTPTHTYADMVADLLQFLDDHNIEKANLLGHSMGGKTVMLFANQYPQRVNKLVVVDIAPVNYADPSNISPRVAEHQKIIATMAKIPVAHFATRTAIDKVLEQNITSLAVRQFILKNLNRKGKGFAWKLNVNTIQKYLLEIMNGISNGIFQQGYSTPTLFIKGENSDYIGINDLQAINKLFPKSEIVVIPNAGHWVHAQQPKLLVKTVEYFLKGE